MRRQRKKKNKKKLERQRVRTLDEESVEGEDGASTLAPAPPAQRRNGRRGGP
jgi:hypothetical protein